MNTQSKDAGIVGNSDTDILQTDPSVMLVARTIAEAVSQRTTGMQALQAVVDCTVEYGVGKQNNGIFGCFNKIDCLCVTSILFLHRSVEDCRHLFCSRSGGGVHRSRYMSRISVVVL